MIFYKKGRVKLKVKSLGYILIETTDILKWESYANEVVGFMKNDKLSDSDNLFYKIDEEPFRFHVTKGPNDRYVLGGFELEDKDAFEDAKKTLKDEGIEYEELSNETSQLRGVTELIRLKDPAENTVELYYDRAVDDQKFVSTQDISGFVTQGLGLGHVVFGTLSVEETHDFYTNILGFGDSDIMHMRISPNPDDPESVLYFMHCDNPRHHTVAVMQSPPPPSGLVHVMVEVNKSQEVVHALDRAVNHNVHISSTLGRHMNDKMFSFYMQTPAGFMLEFGCEGIQPDWDTFETTNSELPSYWGHVFSMPE